MSQVLPNTSAPLWNRLGRAAGSVPLRPPCVPLGGRETAQGLVDFCT